MSGTRNIARVVFKVIPITQIDRTPGLSRYARSSSGSNTAEESTIERFTFPHRITAEPASIPAARKNCSMAEPGVVIFASACLALAAFLSLSASTCFWTDARSRGRPAIRSNSARARRTEACAAARPDDVPAMSPMIKSAVAPAINRLKFRSFRSALIANASFPCTAVCFPGQALLFRRRRIRGSGVEMRLCFG